MTPAQIARANSQAKFQEFLQQMQASAPAPAPVYRPIRRPRQASAPAPAPDGLAQINEKHILIGIGLLALIVAMKK
jgi:hypothetical protein